MAKLMTVTIANRSYQISTEENEEYVQELAKFVSDKIHDISSTSSGNALDCATIAALSCADELFKEKRKKSSQQKNKRKNKSNFQKNTKEPLF